MSGFAGSKSKSDNLNASNIPSEAVDLEKQNVEDGMVTLLVAQLAMQEYCKTVTSRPGVADACCKMMTALLQASEEDHYFLVTKEIVCGGKEKA